MYYRDGQFYELKVQQIIFYFTVSLLLNAFGNGLSVSTNMGSAPWTAGAANLAVLFHQPIWVFLGAIALTVAIANQFIAGRWDPRRLFGNVFFGLSFSLLVGLFSALFNHLGVPHLSLWWRIPLDLIGVVNVGIGISIYQRVNFVMHPIDDLTNITRFKYFHGNASKAQMSNFAVAISISAIAFFFSHKLVSLNIGTAFSFFLQGRIIGQTDRRLFPHLVHGNLEKIHKLKNKPQ